MTSATASGQGASRLKRWLSRFGIWALAVAGTVGVGFLLMVLAGVFHEKVPDKSALLGRSLPADAVIVEVQSIRKPRFESAVGTIKPIHESSVAAKILAKVSEVKVTAGQEVEAGELLVKLNDDDLKSRLKQAEAQHVSAVAHAEQANADYVRAQRLQQDNAISRAEFESIATSVRARNAEVERSLRAIEEAKVVLDYATITAPFKGMVVEKQVEPGDTVTPGQTLLTLYDPDQMQLVANVRESLAMKLKIGQQIPARLETLDHECLATVREVVPQADVGSRSFQVKVSGPCPPGIYSGMFGRIKLPLEPETVTVIPPASVRRVGQLTLVDVVQGDRLSRRAIQLGRELDEGMEVLAGLRPGERILLHSRNSSEGAEPTVEGTHE